MSALHAWAVKRTNEISTSAIFPWCSFLAKRGVREDIATFEARNITHEIRQSVEELLHRNKASFDPKVREEGRPGPARGPANELGPQMLVYL